MVIPKVLVNANRKLYVVTADKDGNVAITGHASEGPWMREVVNDLRISTRASGDLGSRMLKISISVFASAVVIFMSACIIYLTFIVGYAVLARGQITIGLKYEDGQRAQDRTPNISSGMFG